jgi:hypothetical protein
MVSVGHGGMNSLSRGCCHVQHNHADFFQKHSFAMSEAPSQESNEGIEMTLVTENEIQVCSIPWLHMTCISTSDSIPPLCCVLSRSALSSHCFRSCHMLSCTHKRQSSTMCKQYVVVEPSFLPQMLWSRHIEHSCLSCHRPCLPCAGTLPSCLRYRSS